MQFSAHRQVQTLKKYLRRTLQRERERERDDTDYFDGLFSVPVMSIVKLSLTK